MVQNQIEIEHGIRRPSTEQAMKNPVIHLLSRREGLLDGLKRARVEAASLLDYDDPNKDGNVTIHIAPDNLDDFKVQREIISNALTQITAINQALIKIDSLKCDNYNTLEYDIRT